MLLLYDVWSYSIVSLIHHLCKREMKRNVEAIVWFLVGCVFCATYITFTVIGKAVYFVLYSIHGVYTGRDPQIPEIPKKRSTSSECKVQKWVWSGCTAAMCLKRVQSPHGNDSNGNNNGEVREEKENPGDFFWAHELGN